MPIATAKTSGWRTMRTAPLDGTLVLVCVFLRPEKAEVMTAAYIARDARPLGDVVKDDGFKPMEPRWWATYPTKFADEDGLPRRFGQTAVTPVCWRPLPKPDNTHVLRRRQDAVLKEKYRKSTKEKK